MGRQQKLALYPTNDRFPQVNCLLKIELEGQLSATCRQSFGVSLFYGLIFNPFRKTLIRRCCIRPTSRRIHESTDLPVQKLRKLETHSEKARMGGKQYVARQLCHSSDALPKTL